jgi:hypothetical protein
MFYLSSKFKYLGFCTLVCLQASCTLTQPLNVNKSENKIKENSFLKVNRIKKADISIVINQSKAFEKKAIAEAILPKTKYDIALYRVFLSKNKLNPFGSSDMITQVKDVLPDTETFQGSVIFSNIADGGPYYAFVSAYEKITTNNNGVTTESFINITKSDSNLQSIDKKWATSINSVNTNLGNNTFSDSTDSLKVTLNLQAGIPSRVDSSIRLFSGAPVSDNVEIK